MRELTFEEKLVLGTLVTAWEEYKRLPVVHPDDLEEFRRPIHTAQLLVLARPARDGQWTARFEENTAKENTDDQ